jgi:hypothetical protein
MQPAQATDKQFCDQILNNALWLQLGKRWAQNARNDHSLRVMFGESKGGLYQPEL